MKRRYESVMLLAIAAAYIVSIAAFCNERDMLRARIEALESRQPVVIQVLAPTMGAVQSEPVKPKQTATFTAYAYCPCSKCCGKSDGITASGTKVQEGRTVAADTSVLPMGTELWIEGVGGYVVEDTGSGIKGRKLDIYMDSHEEALRFGVQSVEVEW